MAEVIGDCVIFSDKSLQKPIGDLYAGAQVEILEDFSAQAYKILENASNKIGWIHGKFLKIPAEAPTDKTVLSPRELECYVKTQAYTSNTNSLILADLNRQKIHVFKWETDSQTWTYLKSFDCSTGLNASPTTRGIFTISARGPWFYSERLSSGAKFWMRFNDQYLIHTIPMNRHMQIIPGEDIVGEKRSNGCIRLMPLDAKWLYENVPDGSTIVII